MVEKDGSWLGRLWREWIRSLLLVVLLVGSFRSAIADWNDVPTGSMKPTILEGDRIVVNKLAYDLRVPFTSWRLAHWGDPKRGDIVILFSPADGKRLVKRVIGLPGDTISMRGDRLVVDGHPAVYEPLPQDAVRGLGDEGRGRLLAEECVGGTAHPVMVTPGVPAMRSFGPVSVPVGDYFVMGDNRDESGDSRYFGFVPRSRIVGRATAVAVSVDPQRHYLPRWDRFFRALP